MILTNLTRHALGRIEDDPKVEMGIKRRTLAEWAAIERALEELEAYQRAEKEGRLLLVKPGYHFQAYIVEKEAGNAPAR